MYISRVYCTGRDIVERPCRVLRMKDASVPTELFNHDIHERGHRGRGPHDEEAGREEIQGVAGADGRDRTPLQEPC